MNGLDEIFTTEFGPQFLGHPKFAVTDLPEKKVTQSQFTTGPNDQIRVG